MRHTHRCTVHAMPYEGFDCINSRTSTGFNHKYNPRRSTHTIPATKLLSCPSPKLLRLRLRKLLPWGLKDIGQTNKIQFPKYTTPNWTHRLLNQRTVRAITKKWKKQRLVWGITRLHKVPWRDLLNEAREEFAAAQREEGLYFLTEDPDYKDNLLKFSTLTLSDSQETWCGLRSRHLWRSVVRIAQVVWPDEIQELNYASRGV